MERPTTYTLRALVEQLGAQRLVRKTGGRDDVEIRDICDDSRKVSPGSLFVAVRGSDADGHGFIPSALDRGAVAVIAETEPVSPSTVPVIEVSDSRLALAILSHYMAGRPSDRLRMVGVTGTNGKTTTAWLIHHMLMQVGREAGLLGTIETKIGSRRLIATLTTPGPIELSSALSDMVDAGCTDCVMEISSHALTQHRAAGIRFSAAVFTNLTRDHLDYHRTWDAYLGAKKSLFDGLDGDAATIYNADDPSARLMIADAPGSRHAFGRTAGLKHTFRVIENDLRGLRLEVDGEERAFHLVGAFNAYNLTAAYSVGRAFGYERSVVLDALASAKPVPGRLEQITFPSGVTAIVDYAHTPDALRSVLEAVKEASRGSKRLWCVFGCGGDRDKGKRPLMGEIAEQLADRVVVTSDNPRTEDAESILEDVRSGMRYPEKAEWLVDRREAIRYAATHARPGDTVVVAGKGHEDYQVIGRERVHFDDREEVRRWFA